MRRMVARGMVGPLVWIATALAVMVTVDLWRLARCETSGTSMVLGTCCQVRLRYPSSSFLSSFLAAFLRSLARSRHALFLAKLQSSACISVGLPAEARFRIFSLSCLIRFSRWVFFCVFLGLL